MFVSGVGGTGKSFVIEAIKALITNIWPTDDLTFAVMLNILGFTRVESARKVKPQQH